FYDKAFGSAARPMEQYYARWLGSYVAIHGAAPAKSAATGAEPPRDELGQTASAAPQAQTAETLKAAYRDLDEAAGLVKDQPEYRARVDHLRLYAHYLFLRLQLEQAAQAEDREKVRAAVAQE